MTGQEARDDEREALIAAARTSIADADRCVALHITPSTGTLHRRLREVTRALADAHAELAARKHPELAARKHPEPEITDEMVDGAGHVLYASWDDWAEDDDWAEGTRALVRTALEAALRVPVGEGERAE